MLTVLMHIYVVDQFNPWFKFFPLFWGIYGDDDSEFNTKGNKI